MAHKRELALKIGNNAVGFLLGLFKLLTGVVILLVGIWVMTQVVPFMAKVKGMTDEYLAFFVIGYFAVMVGWSCYFMFVGMNSVMNILPRGKSEQAKPTGDAENR